MNMNLYLRELNKNRKGLFVWSIIIIGLVVMIMAIYPSIAEQAENYEKMLEGFPEAFSAMFGLNELSMSDLFGFYAVEGFLIVVLMGSIYAMMLSSGILSKEEGDKTIEFLLAKPISRREVVTSKLLCYLTNILILNIVLSIVLFISFKVVSEESFSLRIFVLICLAPLFLELVFASIGFLISVFITKSKKIMPITMGVVFVTYFFGIMSEINENMEFLKYLSPFKYFEAKDIILDNQMDIKNIVFMLVVNIICIGLTYFIYERKDITT